MIFGGTGRNRKDEEIPKKCRKSTNFFGFYLTQGGKTTLLNCISRFIPHEKGKILLAENDISHLTGKELAKLRNRQMGFVFQDFMLLDGLTVFENICLPQIIARRPAVQMEEKAAGLCRMFCIDRIMEKYPAEISGGEKQRTAVARALMNQPYVILADEPTGNLDSRSCKAVIDAFVQAKEEMGATIFMVTHDSFAAFPDNRTVPSFILPQVAKCPGVAPAADLPYFAVQVSGNEQQFALASCRGI